MRTRHYRSEALVELFQKQKIATLPELKSALGTQADITVFRRLAELGYRTSYTHRGKYYTLDAIPEYDEWGLWCYRSACFSKRGTLVDTAAALVEESEAGYFAMELDDLLTVDVKGTLLKLVRQHRLDREKVIGRYLYCSKETEQRRRQVVARRLLAAQPTLSSGLVHDEVMPDEVKASIVLFFSLLDERQRRLYAGLESLKLGHGGDQRLATLLGLDPDTVARGRHELLSQDLEVDRVRQRGGGRKPVEKKRHKSSDASKS
jgi:hypothetical protein